MKEPERDVQAAPDEQGARPDFEAVPSASKLVRGERTRDDFLDAVLSLEEPATAEAVANRADHGVDAAREYLEWFERIGIVRQVTDTPATYERNREYLRWRQVEHLRSEYATAELIDFLESAREQDRAFAADLEAESPGSVSITAVAEATERPIESVWEDVSDWRTTRRRIALLERALQSESESGVNGRTPA